MQGVPYLFCFCPAYCRQLPQRIRSEGIVAAKIPELHSIPSGLGAVKTEPNREEDDWHRTRRARRSRARAAVHTAKKEKKLKPAASPLPNFYSTNITLPEEEEWYQSRNMVSLGKPAKMHGSANIAKNGPGPKHVTASSVIDQKTYGDGTQAVQ